MHRIFSNGPDKDFVVNPLIRLMAKSRSVHLAAPFFTEPEPIRDAVKAGKSVQLLVGLNDSTSPDALLRLQGIPNLAVRYLTRSFHAKIFIFDDAAMIGSSNLTDGGLRSNREAVMCLEQPEDLGTIEEVRSLFVELWDAAQVLTPEKLAAFGQARASIQRGLDPDAVIEKAVGRAEPANIRVDSRIRTRERIFLEDLRRQVFEEYRPAFTEVTSILHEAGYRRPELAGIGEANETNRFLNWLRLSYVIGDDTWQSAPHRPEAERRVLISNFGTEWAVAEDHKVPEYYLEWLDTLQQIFGTSEGVETLSKDKLTGGLERIHAFVEQLRFVKGGAANLAPTFWAANNQDLPRVKRTFNYLLHGSGDFIQRLHDVLYSPTWKLGYFGRFCALELYGTLNPEECPPMNGRMAKALRFLGFNVRGA